LDGVGLTKLSQSELLVLDQALARDGSMLDTVPSYVMFSTATVYVMVVDISVLLWQILWQFRNYALVEQMLCVNVYFRKM